MIDSFIPISYDTYQTLEFDSYNRPVKRRYRTRLNKRLIKNKRLKGYPKLGLPPEFMVKRPSKILIRPSKATRNRPKKLPPIVEKPKVKQTNRPLQKPIKKVKQDIVSPPKPKASQQTEKGAQTRQNEAIEKAKTSDTKMGTVIKVLAVVGVLGVAGFGMCKYHQLKTTTV